MAGYPLIDDTRTCWKVAHADRFAFIVDTAEYFRAVKRAVIAAKQQVLMIGWDFDTRIELERDRKTIEGPNRLGEILDWMLEKRPQVDLKILKWDHGIAEARRDAGRLPGVDGQARDGHQARRRSSSGRQPSPEDHRRRRPHRVLRRDRHHQGAMGHARTFGPQSRCGTPPTENCWGHGTMRRRASTGILPRRSANSDANDGNEPPERTSKSPRSTRTLWPEGIQANFHDVDVAISRTIGEFEDQQQVTEIETLVLDIVATAEKTLYIESQYFASREVQRL